MRALLLQKGAVLRERDLFDERLSKKELRELPLNEVHRVKLPHQSRCYVKDRNSDLYRIGRILQWFDGEYEVHFPDQDAGFYSEEDINLTGLYYKNDKITQ